MTQFPDSLSIIAYGVSIISLTFMFFVSHTTASSVVRPSRLVSATVILLLAYVVTEFMFQALGWNEAHVARLRPLFLTGHAALTAILAYQFYRLASAARSLREEYDMMLADSAILAKRYARAVSEAENKYRKDQAACALEDLAYIHGLVRGNY